MRQPLIDDWINFMVGGEVPEFLLLLQLLSFMIRRPSYKHFLNQTIQMHSHPPTSDNPPLFSQSCSASDFKSTNPTIEAWDSKILEITKNIPKDIASIRYTYTQGRGRQSQQLNESNRLVSPSPNIKRKDSQVGKQNCFKPEWQPGWNEKKKEQPQKDTKVMRIAFLQPEKNRRNQDRSIDKPTKMLYQSKSTTRLCLDAKGPQILKEIDIMKELINKRRQKHDKLNRDINTFQYKWQNNNRTQDIFNYKQIQAKDCTNRQLQKSVSLIKKVSTMTDLKFTPLQFKGKQISGIESKQIYKSPQKMEAPNQKTFPRMSKQFASFNFQELSKPKAQLLTIGDFQLGVKLGQGRFGMVWIATHRQTGALFALKKIPKAMIKNNLMVDQLVLQVKIQSYIDNPLVVKVFGIFDDSQNLYLLLQYLEGGTLYSQLKKKGNLNQQQTSIRINMLCKAVQSIHKHGVAHRDIKPENIILTNGVCKLADFGWATCCDQRRLTYCGTTDYVAPEIVEGLGYDLAVDLWCIGVLTYQLLAGKAPFYHISRKETFRKIANVDTQMLSFPQHFSAEIISFIKGLIRKNPEERMSMQSALAHPFLTKYQL